MNVDFLTQPDVRLGDLIANSIAEHGAPTEFVLVSAFVSLATVLRLKPDVAAITATGGDVRVVLGVDLGGTSKEVLEEVATWAVPVTIVKNQMFGVVFHPKIYLLRWANRAEIIVGSNNLTEGGFYRNYEAASRTTFTLPDDAVAFRKSLSELERFLRPSGVTASLLTPDYLAALLALPDIPSERVAREIRGEGIGKRPVHRDATAVFGYERLPYPPRLPPELQKLLLAARDSQQSNFKKAVALAKRAGATRPIKAALPAQLDPSAFYMTLPAMQSGNNPTIPGEPRIPLEALEMAEDFWGWPDNYETSVSPRKGASAKVPRVYRSWRPTWRISATDAPNVTAARPVRMYLYVNSQDFRFYAGDLIRLGAASGDIVRLRRIDEPDAVFECVLARQGTTEYNEWSTFLIADVKTGNSTRRFGFV